MLVYLVGGAVRDALLGRSVGDRDWVVVGSTQGQMEKLGYRQVGRDFPVYLHPETNEEYALARTERKQGKGHRGFVVNAAPSVTLEEDLQRRDLTINAIAQDHSGVMIDPYNGLNDLQARVLRHVSPAFKEDPLRVFRVARFASVMPGFTVAPDTQALMREMVGAGELGDLAPERVWREFEKALASPAPERFFAVLSDCGGLKDWFAECAGKSILFQSQSAELRFAEMPLADAEFCCLAERLRTPQRYLQFARMWLAWGDLLACWTNADAAMLGDAFESMRVAHHWDLLTPLATLAQVKHGISVQGLYALARQWEQVKLADDSSLKGRDYGVALRRKRLQALDRGRGL